MAYVTNYYVGGQEYVVFFKNGTHEVREILDYEGNYEVVFTGFYEKCINYLNELNTAYQEACLF